VNDETLRHADHPAFRLIGPDESVQVIAEAANAKVLVTDRRVAVASDDRVALDIGFEGLRRIQFDIERRRPATLVIVPEDAAHEPQVLTVPKDRYDEITRALATIGHRLAEAG
jgi:hypothetical protein